MSKFNDRPATIATTNLAGGRAYNITDSRLKLATMMLTTLFNESKYYGDTSNELVNLAKEMAEKDPKFLANCAVYARKEAYLRSIPQVLATILAQSLNGKPYARLTISNIAERPDDMTEMLSYCLKNFGKPVPNSMKKGLADAFLKFDEYQLAKYDRENEIKLRDILCIAHPKPRNAEQAKMFRKVLEGNLETPDTWEVALSTSGNTKENWERLIAEKKLGYMAALRNLRNIIQSKASNIDDLLSYISNPNAVAHSKQLPFRFYSAYNELQGIGSSKVLDAIDDALKASTANLPRLKGKTFMTSDNSSSMRTNLSAKSKVQYIDVATLLMAIANGFCEDSITSVFGESFQVVNVPSKGGTIANMQTFKHTNVGHSTNLHKAIEWLLKSREKVDRIIVFSDMQAYNSESMFTSWMKPNYKTAQQLVQEYREMVNPDVHVHSIDLAGHGTAQFIPGSKTNLIAGWSDRVLEFIAKAEEGTDSLVRKIDGYCFK